MSRLYYLFSSLGGMIILFFTLLLNEFFILFYSLKEFKKKNVFRAYSYKGAIFLNFFLADKGLKEILIRWVLSRT